MEPQPTTPQPITPSLVAAPVVHEATQIVPDANAVQPVVAAVADPAAVVADDSTSTVDDSQADPAANAVPVAPAAVPVSPVVTQPAPVPAPIQPPTSQSAAVAASQSPAAPTSLSSAISFDPAGEIQALKDMVDAVPMPAGLRDKIDKMLLRLTRMVQLGSYSKEYEPVEQYIKWAVQIPWGNFTQDNLDLVNAKESLTKYHYGLNQIKDVILEYLAVMNLQDSEEKAAMADASKIADPAAQQQEMSRLQGSSSHAPILCFVGIQGVGKTSMAKSIGNALNRKFVRVALGALGNVSQIRGTPVGEPNAEPGQIIKALIHSGTMNPLILLDEIDKTSSDSGLRSDLMAALLEILDPEQNSTFVDHYLDYPVDLSQCIFITTANNLGGISAALLDRLEIIRFGSYTDEEKQEIARDYMLPKVREATGIGPDQLTFDDDVWPLVVRPLGFDAGVRQLERTLTLLARKVARQIVEGKGTSFKITKENFKDFIPPDIGVYS